jgi:hypothetical protein
MLLGAETDRLAGGSEEGRWAQATEIPSLFHRRLACLRDFQSMRPVQHIVNSFAKAEITLFTVCNSLRDRVSILLEARSGSLRAATGGPLEYPWIYTSAVRRLGPM